MYVIVGRLGGEDRAADVGSGKVIYRCVVIENESPVPENPTEVKTYEVEGK
jgi:hypothetical protein